MKHGNIHIIGIPEGEEKEQWMENLFVEMMTENSPNLVKVKDTQVQDGQRSKQDGSKEVHNKTHYN